ncbi:MAG: FkbM family methyltransferase [Actinomycetota bacterium]
MLRRGEALSEAVAQLCRLAITYLPPRRRGLRLASYSERWAGRPSRPLLARHVSGYSVTCDLSDDAQRAIFYTGTYEPRLSRLIVDALRPGDVFFDLGANLGHYSLLAARRLGGRGSIHAVEASAQTAARLRETVRRNHLSAIIAVHQVAVGDRQERMTLAHPESAPSPLGMRFLDPSAATPGEAVQVVRLDDYLPEVTPTVVKLDVEGAEVRALAGMQECLRNPDLRCIFAEAIDSQLARFGDSTASMTQYLAGFGFHSARLVDRYFADTQIYWRDLP